jgi:hypothetical protein
MSKTDRLTEMVYALAIYPPAGVVSAAVALNASIAKSATPARRRRSIPGSLVLRRDEPADKVRGGVAV